MTARAALAAFVAARLDEDEAHALAAPGERWRAFAKDDVAGACVYDEQWVLLYPVRYDHDNPMSSKPGVTGPQYIQHRRDELAAHIARNDPARVLREVEAGRKMLIRYEYALRQASVNTGAERESWEKIAGALERDVIDRAAVWSDHPDYNPAWYM